METYRPIVRRLGRCLIVGASLLPLSTGCDSKAVPRAEVIRPVKTMVLAAGEDTRTRLFPGRVEASRRVELAFQVSGILSELPVKEGQKIEKGELIARLRLDEFQARLASLEALLTQARAGLSALQQGERAEEQMRRGMQARSAEARLANAKAELDRSAQLVQSRAVSRSEFELKQTNYRVAQEDHQAALQLVEKGSIGREEDIQAKEAGVMGLEARVVEANLNLSDSTLVAPYAGVIAQRFVEQGQNIRATEPVVRFQDIEEIEIAVDVPETVMVQDIRTADIVRLEVEVSGAPGLAFPVQIREIAQVADPTTQTFNVRVALLAPAEVRMLPGMTATVTAEYRRAKILGQRIMVPVSAVAKDSTGEQAAWILEANGTVRRQAVKIGSIVGGDVEMWRFWKVWNRACES